MDWESVYQSGQYLREWHQDFPSNELRTLLATEVVSGGKALDLGCGAGSEATYLAHQGFDVSAIDLSDTAIELTKQAATDRNVFVDAHVRCATKTGLPSDAYSLIVDRSCFHVMPPDLWEPYREETWRLLQEDGILFMRGFRSASNPEHAHKYFLSIEEFHELFEPRFEIGPIQELPRTPQPNVPARIVLLKKKTVRD